MVTAGIPIMIKGNTGTDDPVTLLTPESVQYEISEFRIDYDHGDANPYDPDAVTLDAEITEPNGNTVTIPGFYYKSQLEPGQWRIRYAPRQPGRYRIRVFARQNSNTTFVGEDSSNVLPGISAGFIHLNEKGRFITDEGTGVVGFGCNLYDSYNPENMLIVVKRLIDGGGNFARIRMDWQKVEKIMLDYDQENAALFDSLLGTCQQNGVYAYLTLLGFRDLLASTDLAWWDDFAYNSENGGPADTPLEFLTGSESQENFQKFLRYCVARWGAFRSLAAWDLINESSYSDPGRDEPETLISWHDRTARYLKSIDPYGRSVTTTSYRTRHETSQYFGIVSPDGLDLIQFHKYGIQPRPTMIRMFDNMARENGGLIHFGEINLDKFITEEDPHGIHLHNILWASSFLGHPVTGLTWWTDYLTSNNLWSCFGKTRNFLENYNLTAPDIQPLAVEQVTATWSGSGKFTIAIDPQAGWGQPENQTPQTIRIPASGFVSDGHLVSTHLWPENDSRHNPHTFLVEDLPGFTFRILIDDDSETIGSIKVTSDGINLYEGSLPADNMLELEVPENTRRLTVCSVNEQIKVTQYQFVNAATLNPYTFAVSSQERVACWVWNPTSVGAPESTGIIHIPMEEVTVSFPSVSDNTHYIIVYDPWENNRDIFKVVPENGMLTVNIGSLDRDKAIVAMDFRESDLDIQEINKSNNAKLSAIRWPDIPYPIDGWTGDTIPDFSPSAYFYTLTVPYGMNNIPALVAHPQNQNAKINIERAVSLSGSQEQRTTTITVLAEDSVTSVVYTILFEKEELYEHLQKHNPDPFFSQIIFRQLWQFWFIEIANPGNIPLNLDEYMVVLSYGRTPAQAIEDIADADSTVWLNRYRKYIPGYKNKTYEDWKVEPAVMEPDTNIDPTVEPNDVFVIARLSPQLYTNANHQIPEVGEVDIHFSPSPIENVFGETGFGWHQAISIFNVNGTLMLFRVENDSVLTGKKPVTDPEDFILLDVIGDYDMTTWDFDGRGLTDHTSWTRKPHIWKGSTEPNGSFGATPEESEWISYHVDDSQCSEQLNREWSVSEGIGNATIDPITVYKSTVTSNTYLVDDGYEGDLDIIGIVAETTVETFFDNIIKADTGQSLTVLSGESGAALELSDILMNGDTLMVVSADSVNTTKYLLEVTEGGLDHNAVLTAVEGSGYTISITGNQGTIEGIEYGSTISEVLSNVEKPETAILNVIDGGGNLVPMTTLNVDTAKVLTRVLGDIYFEVIAQDGETVITYLLKLDIFASDAWVESDVYKVIQEQMLIAWIPNGTSVSTLLSNLVPSGNATMRIIDKAGYIKNTGYIIAHDVLEVTSEDQSVTNIYTFKMIDDVLYSEAYVTSDLYRVSQSSMTIDFILVETGIDDFLSHIFSSEGATVEVLDNAGTAKTTGNILEGDQLVVSSANLSTMVVYYLDLLNTPVDDLKDTGIRVFPNPTTNTLNISGLQPGTTLTLINITGNKIRIVHTNEPLYRMSLKELPEGLYFLGITGKNRIASTFRVVKQ